MHTHVNTRFWWLSTLFAIAVVAWFGWSEDNPTALAAEAVPMHSGSATFVAHVLESEGRPTRVIYIDGRQQVLAVYEIGRDKGEIKFVSSRNISFDLQMMGRNTLEPLPEEIKKQLQMR